MEEISAILRLHLCFFLQEVWCSEVSIKAAIICITVVIRRESGCLSFFGTKFLDNSLFRVNTVHGSCLENVASVSHNLTERMSMLVLTRRLNESIVIGDNISVLVVEVRGDRVRLGINAPKDVPVHRKEVYEAITESGTHKLIKQQEKLPVEQ